MESKTWSTKQRLSKGGPPPFLLPFFAKKQLSFTLSLVLLISGDFFGSCMCQISRLIGKFVWRIGHGLNPYQVLDDCWCLNRHQRCCEMTAQLLDKLHFWMNLSITRKLPFHKWDVRRAFLELNTRNVLNTFSIIATHFYCTDHKEKCLLTDL